MRSARGSLRTTSQDRRQDGQADQAGRDRQVRRDTQEGEVPLQLPDTWPHRGRNEGQAHRHPEPNRALRQHPRSAALSERVALPPEDDIAEIPTTWSKTAHSFKNGPTK